MQPTETARASNPVTPKCAASMQHAPPCFAAVHTMVQSTQRTPVCSAGIGPVNQHLLQHGSSNTRGQGSCILQPTP
jgi:hypothetical protein